jgi:hypothetical protein
MDAAMDLFLLLRLKQKIPQQAGLCCNKLRETLVRLSSLANLSRLDAVTAHLHPSNAPIDDSSHTLQIRKEPPRRAVVCMTDVVSRHRFLSADFTNSRHRKLRMIIYRYGTKIARKWERGKRQKGQRPSLPICAFICGTNQFWLS